MTQTPNLWERLETDTDKSFQAFRIYRDMGDTRTLRKVAEKLSKSETIINRWSMNHQWVDRIAAFEAYQDILQQERNLQRQKLIEDNAFNDYLVLRHAIEKYKSDYVEVQFKGVKPYDIATLATLMKQADDYARRAVGLPDKITEQKTELSGKDGGAIKFEWSQVMQVLTDDDDSFT